MAKHTIINQCNNPTKFHRLNDLFKAHVKGQNMLTRDFEGYATIPNGVAEICTGDGFGGGKIYGITVVKDNRKADDLCTCVFSWDEVHAYIKELNEKA